MSDFLSDPLYSSMPYMCEQPRKALVMLHGCQSSVFAGPIHRVKNMNVS